MTLLKPHHAAILEKMLSHEQQELFTDLEVHLQDGAVGASRRVVAALSDPFTQMLATKMVEGERGVLKLPHVTRATWTCVLQFYLSGRDCVNDANAVGVLEFSHMYGLEALQKRCCFFLLGSCSAANCLAAWRLARVLGLTLLATESLRIVCQNFLQVGQQEDFLDLSFEELLELLGNGDLVTTEDEFSSALLRWMEKNKPSDDNVLTIFNHIQLQKVSLVVLTKLAENPRLQSITSISSRLVEEQDAVRRLGDVRIYPTTPSPRVGPGLAMAVVGYDSSDNICIGTLPPGREGWSTVSIYEYPYVFGCCIKHGDTIIITGGLRVFNPVDTTLLICLKTERLLPGPKLRQSRYLHRMASVDNMVFVAGGKNEKGATATAIERYDAASSHPSWETVGDMDAHLKAGTTMEEVCGFAVAARSLIIALVHEHRGTSFLSFDVDTCGFSILPVWVPVYKADQWGGGVSYADEAGFLCGDGSLHRFNSTPDGMIQYLGARSLEGFGNCSHFTCISDGCRLLIIERFKSRVRCFSLDGQWVKDEVLPSLPKDNQMMVVMDAFFTRSVRA